MKKMKKEEGVTMLSLTIVVAVILIITGIIIYNVRDSLRINDLKEMQNDIENLRDKVDEYYAEKGAIPAKVKYTNIEKIKEAGLISEEADSGEFYVIDLKNLENLTLNYGEDYRNITEDLSQEEVDSYEDIYIINEGSHNIFYVKGIQIDNEWFYTDYTAEDIDNEVVDLRYVEGVKIPKGFYYVGGSKEEGIVISDSKEDLQKGTSHEVAKTLQGNQFVWVPVENIEDFKTYANYNNQELLDWFSDCIEPLENGYTTEVDEYNEMKESVRKYKGFYAGRYEAGKEDGKVVSKQGKDIWNYISWGESMQEIGTEGAVYQSQNMYIDKEKYGITSTLIYGVQWDAIMQWIDPEYKNEDGKLTSFVADSTNKGYYTNNLFPKTTGTSEEYMTKNIYDLAGSVGEWTMEGRTIGRRVNRGGNYNNNGISNPASSRSSVELPYSSINLGFRVALYLNDEENWSATYDVDGEYQDENGDTVTIPKGFQVSKLEGENSIDEGLVIKRASTDDRYVFIEVPKGVFTIAKSSSDYTNIEKDLQEYTKQYKEGYESFEDVWYDGCGLSEQEYNELKEKMLKSVYENKGFWISQYEIGSEENVTAEDNGARTPVSKEGMYAYNYVSCATAQNLASNMDTGEKESSLMFGVQWDLVCKYIEQKGAKTQEEIKVDSTSWGNYYNATFNVIKGKYSEDQRINI